MNPPIIDDGGFNPIVRHHVRHWRAVGPFKTARFEFPKMRNHYYEIVHQSASSPGTWSVTGFDDVGAVCHTDQPSVQAALDAVESGGILIKVTI
jgi:hypothetical protein